MLYNNVPVEYISALNWFFNCIVWRQLTLNDTVNDVGYVQLHCVFIMEFMVLTSIYVMEVY